MKFLLVHHTAPSNNVPDPRAVTRQTSAFHTGPEKRWPDICYHFMIGPGDRGCALLDGWRKRVRATRLQRIDPGPTKRAVRLGVHLT